MAHIRTSAVAAACCACCLGATHGSTAAERPPLEEVVVVAPYGTSIDPALVPANVQRAVAEQLQQSQSLDLTEFLNRQFSSISINHAQNNPLQPDFNFRGFTASPLLGLPQGLSVYQNGVRINDPFGDTINWDLIPLSAIESVQMLAGTQPVFGLNTLGGALSLQMKNGFTYEGTFRQLLIAKGRNRDTAWFSMLDSEWPARKAAFERWLAPQNFGADGRQKLSLSAINGAAE